MNESISCQVKYGNFTRIRVDCQAFLVCFLGEVASYLNLACSAIMESKVAEVPLGLYIEVSHSLIVCWRVPSLSASSR